MTDLEKMKKAIEYNGYKYNVNNVYECIGVIILEVVGYSSGKRLAEFQFDEKGNFILHN